MDEHKFLEKYKVPPATLIDTDALKLRRWQSSDEQLLQTTVRRSMPWVPQSQAPCRAQTFINRSTTSWEQGTEYEWALIVNGEIAGCFSFGPPVHGQIGLSILWWTEERFRGREIEAVESLTRAAFEIGALKVQLCNRTDNESPDIAIRLGFRHLKDSDTLPLVIGPMPIHSLWQMDSVDQMKPISE